MSRARSRRSPASDARITADAPSDTCEQSLTFMKLWNSLFSRKSGFLSEAVAAFSSVILTSRMCALGFLLAFE